MSCPDGSCLEPSRRRRGVMMLGLMMLVFIVLSAFSFLEDRGQVTPDQVSFGEFQATDGKRVFQAYNCMGCHTIVGNGAYFAPDLTKEYERTGPAWLAAFIPSAGGWPTEAAVKTQLLNEVIAEEAGVDNIEDYYEKYPGAKERVQRRGGKTTLMPSLPFRAGETEQLIAFLKYTSEMNTEGWPPKVKIESLEKRLTLAYGKQAVAAAVSAGTGEEESEPLTPVARGEKITKDLGCVACHSTGTANTPVGPAWGEIYGTKVELTDGSSVVIDDDYLRESILDPHAKIVKGYYPTMPNTYSKQLSEEEVNDVVEYLRSLTKGGNS